jgi:hypothetical protein
VAGVKVESRKALWGETLFDTVNVGVPYEAELEVIMKRILCVLLCSVAEFNFASNGICSGGGNVISGRFDNKPCTAKAAAIMYDIINLWKTRVCTKRSLEDRDRVLLWKDSIILLRVCKGLMPPDVESYALGYLQEALGGCACVKYPEGIEDELSGAVKLTPTGQVAISTINTEALGMVAARLKGYALEGIVDPDLRDLMRMAFNLTSFGFFRWSEVAPRCLEFLRALFRFEAARDYSDMGLLARIYLLATDAAAQFPEQKLAADIVAQMETAVARFLPSKRVVFAGTLEHISTFK